MKQLLTLMALLLTSVTFGQFTGFTAIMDTSWNADGADFIDGLAFYASYSVYAEFTNPTDVLAALYSDVDALGTPAAGIEGTCGCYQSAIASSPWLWDINPALIPTFPDLQYSTGWTIGLNDSGAPGTVTPLTQDFAAPCEGFTTTNGAMFVVPEINVETGLVDGPAVAVAGDDLKVLVARITTCGEFTLQSCVQTLPGGDQSLESYVCETLHVPHLYNSGCTNAEACNYDEEATEENGTCLFFDECGICGGSGIPEGDCDCEGNQLDILGMCGGDCTDDFNSNGVCDDQEILGCTYPLATNFNEGATNDDGSCVFPCVGDVNQNIFDWDANGNIGIADFLMMLSVFGDVDVDGDGVWDSQDDCVDFEACNFANDPTEACQYLDILEVCGGGCDVDSDGDGICDDTDNCVGVLDECGVCNGPGPTNIIVETITVFYDSLFLPLDEEWFVYAVDADTTFAFECPPTADGCSDPSEEIPPYSLIVEASEPVNPANGTVYRFYVTAADSLDTFSAVFGNNEHPFHIQTPEGIYNSELNSSWNASGLNATILSFFPEAQDDSFGTIGLDLGSVFPGGEHPGLQQDAVASPSISEYFTEGGTEVFINTLTGMTWFVIAANGITPNSLPVNGRWLIAQITTTGEISGTINYQVFPLGLGSNQVQMSVEFDGCGTFH